MHFLGVVGADVKKEKLKDGRIDHFCRGGVPIGIHVEGHRVLVAGSRGGKSRACILPLLSANGYPGSCIVVDPKGDLATDTWQDRVALGQQCFILDPFKAVRDVPETMRRAFNPLEDLWMSATIVEDAGLIADAIVVREEGGSRDSHWDESARMLIEGLILHVATAVKFEGQRNLVTVYDLLAREINDAGLREDMEISTAADGAIADAAYGFFNKPDNERESVLSTARRHARFLGYPELKDVLSGPTIDLKELKTKRTTIYLSLPAMRLGACSRWLRLLINATLAAMEAERFIPVPPVVICLDEFGVLGHMKSIEDSAAYIRGMGAVLFPVIQDLGILKALYKDRWETFLGNASVIQFFANSDLTTLEWASKRLGETTIITKSWSRVPYADSQKSGQTGESESEHVQALLTPEEISRYFGREDYMLRQLIIVASYPPLILQRAFYDRHELFFKAARLAST